MKKILSLSIVLGILFLFSCSKAWAESSLTVSPALQEVTLEQGQGDQTVEFQITNPTDAAKTYLLRAVDFGNLDATGGKLFQGQHVGDEPFLQPAPWIQLPEPEIMLGAHATQTLAARVINDDKLAPGSHYGGMLIETKELAPGENQIRLRQIAAPLIFATKVGGATEALPLSHLGVDTNWYGRATSATLTFKNTGNVYSRPYGIVIIVNPLGHIVQKQVLNKKSAIFFPGEEKELKADFTPFFPFIPGKYTVAVKYHYGESGDFVDETSFHTYTGAFVLSVLIVILASATVFLLQRRKRKRMLKKGSTEG